MDFSYFSWIFKIVRKSDSCKLPKQISGPIGSAVHTFIGHKQTNRQTAKVYIYANSI